MAVPIGSPDCFIPEQIHFVQLYLPAHTGKNLPSMGEFFADAGQ
jgi:hypothetical protein